MPRASLRQRAVVHEPGSGWRASLAGRTASETGAVHVWLKQSFGAQVHSKSMTIVLGAPSAPGTG